MAINTTDNDRELRIKLPFNVKSGMHLLSTGNESANLCQEEDIAIDEPLNDITVDMPGSSLNTYIFMLDNGSTAITDVKTVKEETTSWLTLDGRRLNKTPTQKGIYIHNGKKVVIK